MVFGPISRNGLILMAILSILAMPQSAAAMKNDDTVPKTIISETASYMPLTVLATFNSNISGTLDLGAPAALTGIDVTINADPGVTLCDILLQRSPGDTPTESFGRQLFYHAASGLESIHVTFDPPVALNDPLDVITSASGGPCWIRVVPRARLLP